MDYLSFEKMPHFIFGSNRQFTENEHHITRIYDMSVLLLMRKGVLRFTENGTPENGDAANSIEVSFSGYKTMNLTYHEDTGLYTGFQHGNRYYDGDNNTDVTFTNVMVLYADTKVIDSYGRLDVKLTGEGTGYFACGGKYEEINWSREDLNSPFEYMLKDGSQLELGVGKSYIAVIATDGGKVTFE